MKKRKRKIIIILVCLLFGLALGAAGFVAWKLYGPEKSGPDTSKKKDAVKSQTTANPLDGTQVSPELARRRPLAIIVENQTQARPQVGLDKASIIYEAISEGGITRFMAIYGPQEAEKVGPVRSLRTYFLDWAWEYLAFLAHVGGNIDALDRIEQEKPDDLDEFKLGENAYWREPEAGKAIEHTMYTSLGKLYAYAKEKSLPQEGDFQSLKFLDAGSFQKDAAVTQEITIDFSSPQYQVKYAWDSLNNNYPRGMAGSSHKDKATGNQLAPTNIIIQAVERTEGLTRINETGWQMKTIGEGKAYVLYGGKKIESVWKKKDLKARTLFYDAGGREIEFLPGQFWYEIVPPEVFEKIKIEEQTSTQP
ncbi:MAG TPA: DUF3048 domain-containing protein [Patescibacteria group bacterium]|nr:DUF3048 domain-containing protein [Patescibacteria group bacterium]